MNTQPYKTKQFFFVLIKLSIVVAAFYFIYHKLINNTHLNFNDFIGFSFKNDDFSIKKIIILLILTFFNWFFEILKWQKLVIPVQSISFNNALEQSLGALTASLFTPNRIGEYGAKAVFYSQEFRKRILLINLISNSLQMIVTTLFGVIGLSFFIHKYPLEVNFNEFTFIIIIGVIVLLPIGYFFQKKLFTIKGFQIKKIINYISHFPKKIILSGFGFSIIRYLIFSFQFYYLLYIFGVEMDYISAMCIITSMYFLASILPSIFIFDVVIKGSVAVYLFSFLNVNEITILVIITLMWMLNFVLPSMVGSYYVLRFNFPENTVKA
jgi:hypothetical protein